MMSDARKERARRAVLERDAIRSHLACESGRGRSGIRHLLPREDLKFMTSKKQRGFSLLEMIITVAKTVSRASSLFAPLADSIIDTMSATSITVTDTLRINVPNGSPTQWATISAW